MQHPSNARSPEHAVEYEGVSFAYSESGTGATRLALENISLCVHAGERLGILGPNGGGKSTLLKLTLGLLHGTGTVRVFGRSPAEARRAGLIGFVAQRSEAESAFPLSVAQVVEMGATVGLSPFASPSSETKAAIAEALRVTGADEFAAKPIGALSGGQFQRAMIARALAGKPKLLLLDEPMVGVDPAGQQQFALLLERLSRELGLTIMVVSHDLRTVASGCDRVACLSRTLHFHDDPAGLTPAVLAEVFRHDVAAIFGPAVALDASQPHTHGPGCTHHHPPVQINLPPAAPRKEAGA
ncbi:MAG: ATP-binding cassette domain-containing protein [Planctomycetota bacterium]|nr:ATP-binding cassette domain-containing protein [Planctomycetota bacterium]